ncbi:MAG: hypothetical protein H6677_16850 [Candidatus Obscuribacterales bacterium]|nr:hypothetical protein [Candidatus Obscuribacterales bacterium]
MDSPTAAGAKDPERAGNTQLYEGGPNSRTSDRVDSKSDKVAEGVTLAHPEIQGLLEQSYGADKTAPKPDIIDGDNKMSLDTGNLYSTVFDPTARTSRAAGGTDSPTSKTSPSDKKDQAGFKDYDSKKGREEYLKEKREQGIAPPELEHGPRRSSSSGNQVQLERSLRPSDSQDNEGGSDRSASGGRGLSPDRSVGGEREGAREVAPGAELESFFAEDPVGGDIVDPGDGNKGDKKGIIKGDNKDSGRDQQPPGRDQERGSGGASDGGRSDSPVHDGTTTKAEPDLTGAEQSTHVLKPEETIDTITGDNLGDVANDQQRSVYARAVRELNGLEPGQEPAPGTELKLPGVDESDNFTYDDGAGNSIKWNPRTGDKETIAASGDRTLEGDWGKTVYGADGTTTSEYTDGSKSVSRADGTWMRQSKDGVYESGTSYPYTTFKTETGADGRTVETHKGDRDVDTFTLTKDAQGNYELTDKDGNVSEFPPGESAERDELLKSLDESIEDPAERSRFIADMIRFENRAGEDNLPEGAVSDTYKEVGRLLDTDTEGKVPAEMRETIAEQVMAQAADPSIIDQGYHNTCNITTVENRMYARDPAAAARFVTDAAMTGEASLADGRKVTIPESAYTADFESGNHPVPDGKRGIASQIFQVGAVNAHYQANGEDRRYEQTTPPLSEQGKDTGERLFDTRQTPPVELQQSPGLSDADIANTYALLTGDNSPSVIHNADRGKDDPGVTAVSSAEDLSAALTAAKEAGNLPITLVVHTQNEPFFTDSGAGAAGGSGGWHVVNITDFDAETGKAMVDNQWGTDDDHLDQGVDVNQLYMATMNPEKAAQTAEMRSAEEIVDRDFPGLEGVDRNLKLMEHLTGDNLSLTLGRTMIDISDDFRANGNNPDFDKAGYQARLDAVGDSYDRLPEDQRGQALLTATTAPEGFPPEKFDSAFSQYAQDTGLTRERGQEFVDAFKVNDHEKIGEMLKNLDMNQLNGYVMIMTFDTALQDRLLALLPE